MFDLNHASLDHPITRRALLRYGGSAGRGRRGATSAGGLWQAASALAKTPRVPDSLPDPRRPAGTVNEALPFDHIVVVMMENHSFDNLLGALSRVRPAEVPTGCTSTADGARHATPTRAPAGRGDRRSRFPRPRRRPSHADLERHPRADRRRHDGRLRRARSTRSSRWATGPQDVLPFAYSLARTFTLANRWFCSAPCQTYPNRRFLMAGTAYGDIATSVRKPARTRRRRTARSSTACTPTGSAGATTSPTCRRRRSSRRSSRNTRAT